MIEKNKYITVKETSESLGIPLKTTYRLIKQHKIKAIKIGGRIKCLFSDVVRIKNYGMNSAVTEAQDSTLGHNRRKAQRLNSNITCQYSIDLMPFKKIISKGIVRNISTGAVYIVNDQVEQAEHISVDDPIDIRFYIGFPDEKPKEISVIGRVIRKSEEGIAVKFRRIDENTKEEIQKYIG